MLGVPWNQNHFGPLQRRRPSAVITGCETPRGDGWQLDRGLDEKMLLVHSADLFKTLADTCRIIQK